MCRRHTYLIKFRARSRRAPGNSDHRTERLAPRPPPTLRQVFLRDRNLSQDRHPTADALKGSERVILHLGQVHELAEVTLNGKLVGTAWHAPFRVEVTGAPQSGCNPLEIHIANLWVNRLIGDEQPGATPIAFTVTATYKPDAPLASWSYWTGDTSGQYRSDTVDVDILTGPGNAVRQLSLTNNHYVMVLLQ